MLTINTLIENAKKNELLKEVNALDIIKTLIDEKVEVKKEMAKNNTINYIFPLSDNYSIIYKPSRNEFILRYDNSNILEAYPSKKMVGIGTRGNYLLKMKLNKKDEALKNTMKLSMVYHPKYDMKHHFKLPSSMMKKLFNKMMSLDYNSNLKVNDFVKEGEDLDSVKSIYLKKVEGLEEEEEA